MEAGGAAAGEEEALVENFRTVTASTREEARFFLESYNWMLDAAIHSFFDSDETAAVQQDDDYIPAYGQAQDSATVAPASPGQPLQPAGRVPPRSVGPRDNSPPAAGRPAIRTLADLNRRPSLGSDDDSDESQEYYTGGEKSGMLVRDPLKDNHDVDAIFEQARQMGALEGPLEHHPSSSSRNFTGTGRLLSGETVRPPAPQQPENIIHNICFWRNGFTVSDGPLRRFDDPENASFLESIRKSECPKELEPADRRSTVNVILSRKEENCPEPVKRCTPFQGVGRTLGSGSSSGPVSSEPAVDAAASIPSSSSGLFVDESLPTTSIQLRLADGTRMVARFNTHHTVGDIRAFINASRPGAGIAYQLQTVDFPPKLLSDVAKTIEEAGLSNSVIIQRI